MAEDQEPEEKPGCPRCGGEAHEWALRVRRPDLDAFMEKALKAINEVVVPMGPEMQKEIDGLGGKLFDAASNAIGAVISAPVGEKLVSVGVDVGPSGCFTVRAVADEIMPNGLEPDAKRTTVKLMFDLRLTFQDVYVETAKDHGHTEGPAAPVGTA